MKRAIVYLSLTGLILSAHPAAAHHSFAMFDRMKTVEFSDAVVKDFQFTNPHSWLDVVVTTPNGPEVWGLELTALGALERTGWKHGTLSPGDKIKVSLNPLRDGTHGGRLINVTLPDGQVLDGQGRPS